MLVGLRSRKHIHPFDLLRPQSTEDACAAKAPHLGAAFMAGGLDLIDCMKNGVAFDRLISLEGITALKGIRRTDGRIVIGAFVTHAEIADSELLAGAAPDLPAVWATLANPRVRYAGTIGGNLMSGLPHYDAAPALIALGAEATVCTTAGRTVITIDRLPDHRGALLENVSIAEGPPVRLLADRSLHPMLSVYLGARVAGEAIQSAWIAIGCTYAKPLAADLAPAGRTVQDLAVHADDIAQRIADGLPPGMLDDGLASAAYRRRMCRILIRRLLVRLGAVA
jgi:aerobic carbon-monoxide dehydrogenase medium subunit